MLTGIDHLIIAVRELELAAAQFGRAMGLVVTLGGRHPGRGTHNAIASFGLSYFELLAIADRQEAARGERGARVRDFLALNGEGLFGFVLASDDLAGDRAAMERRGVAVSELQLGRRERPDGTVMEWQMATVAGDLWGERVPFLIQHGAPPEERMTWAPPGGHPLGATRIAGLSLAVGDLARATARYEQLLGKPADVVEEVPALPARRSVFIIGEQRLELLEPAGKGGGLAKFVEVRNEGVFLVTLAVPDVDRAVQELGSRGTAAGKPTPRRRAPLLNPAQTLGARFQLVEGK